MGKIIVFSKQNVKLINNNDDFAIHLLGHLIINKYLINLLELLQLENNAANIILLGDNTIISKQLINKKSKPLCILHPHDAGEEKQEQQDGDYSSKCVYQL